MLVAFAFQAFAEASCCITGTKDVVRNQALLTSHITGMHVTCSATLSTMQTMIRQIKLITACGRHSLLSCYACMRVQVDCHIEESAKPRKFRVAIKWAAQVDVGAIMDFIECAFAHDAACS